MLVSPLLQDLVLVSALFAWVGGQRGTLETADPNKTTMTMFERVCRYLGFQSAGLQQTTASVG